MKKINKMKNRLIVRILYFKLFIDEREISIYVYIILELVQELKGKRAEIKL